MEVEKGQRALQQTDEAYKRLGSPLGFRLCGPWLFVVPRLPILTCFGNLAVCTVPAKDVASGRHFLLVGMSPEP